MPSIQEVSEELHKVLFLKNKKGENIIKIILENDLDRRDAISEFYQKAFNEDDLESDLKDQLNRDFLKLVIDSFTPLVVLCCKKMNQTINGKNVDDKMIFQILTNSPSWIIEDRIFI